MIVLRHTTDLVPSCLTASTGLVAAVSAGIWLGFLARRERRSPTAPLTGRESAAVGAISGVVPMAAVVCLYELIYADSRGAAVMFSLIAAAGLAGTLCAIATSGIVALRKRATRARIRPPAREQPDLALKLMRVVIGDSRVAAAS